jgi:hypothetical protein
MNPGNRDMVFRVAGGLLVLSGCGVLVLARKTRSFRWLLVGVALAAR